MVSSYEDLAAEYYERRHITSRNFDEATLAYLRQTPCNIPSFGYVLDLGSGRGTANRYCGVSTVRVVQLDAAFRMLRLEPREPSLARIQADALALPFKSQSFRAVVSFLFDPFNSPTLFREISRVLAPGGRFLGTQPHPTWGLTLRSLRGGPADRSRFLNRAGQVVEHRSVLAGETQLADSMTDAGFRAVRIVTLQLQTASREISKDIVDPAHTLSVVPTDLPILLFVEGTRA